MPEINAPDLFQLAGQTYLFATPGGPVQFSSGPAEGYRGCLAVQVADLDQGTVKRSNGLPTVARSTLGAAEQFVGACTAAEGAPALGVAGDVLSLAPHPFGIFTQQPAP